MQLEFGTDHDHRASGIVDTLAKQVLAEPALLALEHVGQGLERTLVGTRDHPAPASVVEQRVDGLLKHPLFVADDDVGRAQLNQTLQAVVPVDNPAIQIVQVRRCEAAAVERHQRAQFRRDHRNDRHDHPFRPVRRIDKGFDHLEPLGQFLRLEFGLRFLDLDAQIVAQLLQVQILQQLADGFGTDASGKAVLAVLLLRLQVLFLRQELHVLERGQARLDDDVALEIEHPLQILERHVEQKFRSGSAATS